MILFYSEFCEHCNILLETIKRHDKNNKIKLVSIDDLRALNKTIDHRIHSVPALMFLPSKELIFGKAVFDHLLLPNRGALFIDQHSTRDKEKPPLDNNVTKLTSNDDIVDEPLAFTLGSISADNFSNIDDENAGHSKDKNYSWMSISNSETSNDKPSKPIGINLDDKISNKLPSMEEILQKREKDMK